MYFLVTVFALVSVMLAADVNAQSSFSVSKSDTEIYEKCIEDIGLSEKEVTAALDNHDRNADGKVKCFNACLFKAYNVINSDGTVDPEAAVSYYKVADLEKDKKIIMECSAKTKESNDCETAQAVESCYYTMRQKH